MAAIEMLTMANHAEAHRGMLYLSGAGWDNAVIGFGPDGGPSVPFHFGIGVSVLVPWTETNRPRRLELRIEHEDGGEPLVNLDGEIQVGRPVGIREGTDQRAVLAVSGELQFPRQGGYRLVARVDDSTRTYSFRVQNAGQLENPPIQAAG
jgi:hypothetical protein